MLENSFLEKMQTRAAPTLTREAFSLLYEETHLIVFRYIYSMYNAPKEDIEDLTAETYWKAWRARKRFSGSHSAAVGWLLKIAKRLVIDKFRQNKTRGYTLDIHDVILTTSDLLPEESALLQENMTILFNAMENLPIQQREILILRYVLGWRVKEIGEHLQIAENTISVTIRRTLSKLKVNMSDCMETKL